MNTPNHTLALTAIRFLLATGGIILLTRSVLAQLASTPDPRFWQPDGPVNALFEKNRIVYLGGAFTYLGPFTGGVGAIDLTTGQANRAFPKTDGAVFAVASDGNGGWYVGGSSVMSVALLAITSPIFLAATPWIRVGNRVLIKMCSRSLFPGIWFTSAGSSRTSTGNVATGLPLWTKPMGRSVLGIRVRFKLSMFWPSPVISFMWAEILPPSAVKSATASLLSTPTTPQITSPPGSKRQSSRSRAGG